MDRENAHEALGNVVAFRRKLAAPSAPPRDRGDRGDRGHRIAPAIALAVVVLAGLGLAMWRTAADRRAIESMGSSERRGLFLRTQETLRTACARPLEALSEYCEGQATFLLQFPECDAACEALARAQLSRTKAVR